MLPAVTLPTTVSPTMTFTIAPDAAERPHGEPARPALP